MPITAEMAESPLVDDHEVATITIEMITEVIIALPIAAEISAEEVDTGTIIAGDDMKITTAAIGMSVHDLTIDLHSIAIAMMITLMFLEAEMATSTYNFFL